MVSQAPDDSLDMSLFWTEVQKDKVEQFKIAVLPRLEFKTESKKEVSVSETEQFKISRAIPKPVGNVEEPC
jgi:hypothetical protein